jgi:Big-like domain-containing protein
MTRYFPNITGPLLLLQLGGTLACGGGDVTTPPTTGSVEVTTSTTGAEPDLDGYTVQLDAESPRGIGSAATLRMEEVAAGPHTVQLAGLALNCTLSGDNPRTLSLAAGETTSVTFAVTCSATTGSLEVTASTGGTSPDADGYSITLDGADRGPLGVSASVTLTGLTPGSHVVGLSGVAANCGVQGDNPRVAIIPPGASATVAFSITCAAPPAQAGILRITTVTTGPDQDPDGYAVAVDAGPSQPVGVNSVTSLAGVAAGSHRVRLSGVASNCVLEGTNPRPVTVATGATAELGFAVSCTARTPSAAKSTVEASPPAINVLPQTSTITVTVRDGNDKPLAGVSVTLSSTGTDNTITPASATSDAKGQAAFTFGSLVAETKTITAVAGGVEITRKATVTVGKAASTLTIESDTPDPSVVNQAVRVTFFVTGFGEATPSGSVTITVSDGPETCTATLQIGFCDVVLLAPGAGSDHQRVITGTYSGDASFAVDIDTEPHRVDPSIFEVVSVRDHIPGSFLVQRGVYADHDRIYLGSYQGDLFVLARDRAADFPVIQTIQLGVPITGVRGDTDRLYVSSGDGRLRVYAKGSSLSPVATRAFSTYGLGTLEVFQDKVYVTRGSGKLAVDRDRLYLAQLNEGDVAFEIDKVTLEVTRTYGETFVEGRTAVYDRLTGAMGATIPFPPQQLAPPGQPNLYLNGNRLMETVPGCCGWGITIIKSPEFVESEFISEAGTNAVVAVPNGFWSGIETGEIGFYDSQDHLVQKLNLPTLTGHTGSEDIEIRALWADGFDDLVFAASSWGNDASRGPTLPAFFVLRLK